MSLKRLAAVRILLPLQAFAWLGFVCGVAYSQEPSEDSYLRIMSGEVSGQNLDGAAITVEPNARIQGSIQLAYENHWPPNAIVPLGAVADWGSPQAWVPLESLSPQNTEALTTVSIDMPAPPGPGTYHIIFAFSAELNFSQVASMTNWSAGEPVWGDGNDLRSWGEAERRQSSSAGRVSSQLLVSGGRIRPVVVPAAVLSIVVTEVLVSADENWALTTLVLDDQGRPIPGATASLIFGPLGRDLVECRTTALGVCSLELTSRPLRSFDGIDLLLHVESSGYTSHVSRLTGEATPLLEVTLAQLRNNGRLSQFLGKLPRLVGDVADLVFPLLSKNNTPIAPIITGDPCSSFPGGTAECHTSPCIDRMVIAINGRVPAGKYRGSSIEELTKCSM